MRILGIETSCDETAVAIYSPERGLIANIIYTQAPMHAQYGGVVPELASRDHIQKCIPLVHQACEQAGLTLQDIDALAYTAGPGLIGALLVGACFGRSLALALNIPAVGVHHLEGHLLASLLDNDKITFPFLALLVSGGHTLLAAVNGVGQYEILGESLDDAAGEAFDKTAKILGLGYPGGPQLARLAEHGDPSSFDLPRPMIDRPGLDFSFSGLKTSVMNAWRASAQDDIARKNIAASFQAAVVETLTIKALRALEITDLQQLVVAGGVGANQYLRAHLHAQCAKRGAQVFFPRPELCTDNAAMIAFAGYHRLQMGEQAPLSITVKSRWGLGETI